MREATGKERGEGGLPPSFLVRRPPPPPLLRFLFRSVSLFLPPLSVSLSPKAPFLLSAEGIFHEGFSGSRKEEEGALVVFRKEREGGETHCVLVGLEATAPENASVLQ